MTPAQQGPVTVAAGPAAVSDDLVAARAALRRFASGVSVLTVDDDGIRQGVTVSALVPVSRDPVVLAVCLRAGSRFGTLLREDTPFSVNVLASDQTDVAERFANPRRPAGDAQFTGLAWAADPVTGAPLLAGCVSHLACRVTGRSTVGSHELVLAEVRAGAAGFGFPLLSYAGRLHAEAAEILL